MEQNLGDSQIDPLDPGIGWFDVHFELLGNVDQQRVIQAIIAIKGVTGPDS
jgi:hypothetical protein